MIKGMKIDRLLAITIHLLGREVVSASALAQRFEVSVRTIQRDMQALELAGIPIYSLAGPQGGYGILKSFKLERQLLTPDDLYYITAALEGCRNGIFNEELLPTIDKLRSHFPSAFDILEDRNSRLSIDFSMIGGIETRRDEFRLVRQAVEQGRLLQFLYTSNTREATERILEPMTLVFRWRSWYLFGYCRLRQDYRLFKLARMHALQLLPACFPRRPQGFTEWIAGQERAATTVTILLRFPAHLQTVAEEYFPGQDLREQPDGSLLVTIEMPEDHWVYGFLLSFGSEVEVLDPPHIRDILREKAAAIARTYS